MVAGARRGKSGQSSQNFLPEVKVSLPEGRGLREDRPSLDLNPHEHSVVEAESGNFGVYRKSKRTTQIRLRLRSNELFWSSYSGPGLRPSERSYPMVIAKDRVNLRVRKCPFIDFRTMSCGAVRRGLRPLN